MRQQRSSYCSGCNPYYVVVVASSQYTKARYTLVEYNNKYLRRNTSQFRKNKFKAVLRIRIRSDPVFLGHPDPDPGKYRIRILYPQKDPCNSKFLVIKLSKKQFRPNNFVIFDFKCHRMFRFGKEIP